MAIADASLILASGGRVVGLSRSLQGTLKQTLASGFTTIDCVSKDGPTDDEETALRVQQSMCVVKIGDLNAAVRA